MQSVFTLLSQFIRHAGDGGLEEEGDVILVDVIHIVDTWLIQTPAS